MSQPPPWGPPGDDAERPATPPAVPQSPDPVPGSGSSSSRAVPPPSPAGAGWSPPYGAPRPGAPPPGTPPPADWAPHTAPQYGVPAGPPRRGVPAWVWVLVGLGAFGLVGFVALLALVLFAAGGASEEELSRLYGRCAEGDMASCDGLFRESPIGSEYEDFGDTCGGRTDGGTWCTELDQ